MSRESLRLVGLVALWCLFTQVISATWFPRSLETPNASTVIARHLADTGIFAMPNGEQAIGTAGAPGAMRRAYQLPGEPIYLAAGFRLLPQSMWPYLHLPITVLFVTCLSAVGILVAGPAVGVLAGMVASVDPFFLAHGPVWDDTFLAAALDWGVLFVLVATMAHRSKGASSPAGRRWLAALVVCLLAAGAAATRAQSQVVLVTLGVLVIALKTLRPIRLLGGAILIGVLLSLAAWGTRNAVVLGHFYVGSTHDGKGLLDPNCASTRESILETGWVGARVCSASLAQELPSLGELEADARYRRAAGAYVASHPFDFLATAGLKLAVSLSGIDFGAPLSSVRNVAGIGASLAILALGLYGLRTWTTHASRAPVRRVFLIACSVTCVATIAMLLVGPVGLRYRIDMTGFLFLGSAMALTTKTSEALGKRALDITLSGVGLLVSMPIWAVVAAAIKLEDGGAIFYTQDRVGQGGRIFRVLKFRSMIPDAEARVGALQAAHGDARITRVGRLLRATAADELPQLWNIFRGDMSFVGPRALRPGEIEVHGDGQVEALEDVPGFADRCRVRPGLTGVAQIYAARDIPRRYKFQYDKVYLRKQSFGLDVRLILLSFWITFRGTWEVRGKKF